MITRFAPAPTGHLHLGHVLNALHVWEFARANGGRVLLRIEDHDAQRCRPEFERSIRDDLAWLGFTPDAEVPRQSERDEAYRSVLAELVARGLVYGCACTRQEIAAIETPGANSDHRELIYPGACRDRGLGLVGGLGWRVRMDPGAETFIDGLCGPQSQDPSRQCGDLLIRDRLGNWTYQWAATIDDYLQQIDPRHSRRRSPGVHRPADPARAARRTNDAGDLPSPSADHEVADAEAQQVRSRQRRGRSARGRLDTRRRDSGRTSSRRVAHVTRSRQSRDAIAMFTHAHCSRTNVKIS